MKTDFFDTLFDQLKNGLSQKLFVELIVRKCGKRGIRLSAKDKRAMRNWFASGAKGEPPPVRKKKRGDKVVVQLTTRDARRLIGQLSSQIDEAVSSAALSTVERTSRPTFNAMRRLWIDESARYDRSIRAFEGRLRRTWKRPFNSLEVQLLLARGLGARVNDELRQTKRKRNELVEAMTRLHARACQISAEISILLHAGYAGGALMRWRSLHEVSVVLQFIRVRGIETAKRYLQHDIVESWKAAHEYSIHCTRLGYEPISAEELAEVKQAFDAMILKYGPTFRGSYGWAAADLGVGKPSFADIEKEAGYSHFRPFYRMASHSAHANPKGILFQIGMLEGEQVLPVGPTNYGLADAMQNTALTLSQATGALATLAPSFDRLLIMRIMADLAGDIGQQALAVQNRIENRERKIRETAEGASNN